VRVQKIVEIRLKCDDCGSTGFRLPVGSDDENVILSCNGCGEVFGTVAQVNEQIVAAGEALTEKPTKLRAGIKRR
jgi:uncharacterized Zn finger protein